MIRNVSHLCLIITVVLFQQAVTQKCQTSTVQDGICIPISDCNSILHRLAQVSISTALKQKIRELQCGYRNGSPYVCCDLRTLYPYRAIVERFTKSNVKVSSHLGNLFPASDMCGVDLSSLIYRIDDVGMYEYPGTVMLKYGNEKIGCGGILINHRYVLTAASCLSGDIVGKFGKIKSIRLGEHDLATDPECDHSNWCRHYIESEVAEIVIPKNFILNGQHDLALIRLADDVNTVKFQPPCLIEPIDVNNDLLRVVGWGITYDGRTTTERKYLAMNYVNETECYDMMARQGIASDRMPTNAICTKRQKLSENSVCPLDGGGVLMARSKNNRWTIVGIASYRPDCGGGGLTPAIFTDVSYYFDWIEYNMRP